MTEIVESALRKITLTDHPTNIAVFEASDMYEAIDKADEAFSRPGIQGMVWASKPVPVKPETELRFGIKLLPEPFKNWAEGLNEIVIHATSRGNNRPNLTLEMPPTAICPETELEKMHRANLLTLERKLRHKTTLDKTRCTNLFALSDMFGSATLNVRRQRTGEGIKDGHYDGCGRYKPDHTARFSGIPMRLLCTREKQGTLVKDETTQEWWQVETGHSIFIPQGNTMNKAVWHAEPEFKLQKETFPRIVDVYDFQPRI